MSERDDELLGEEGSNTILDQLDSLDERVGSPSMTRAGLAHLGVVVLVLAGLAALPYASTDLRRWQPWVEGEGVPIVRMFQGDGTTEAGMALATGGAVTRGSDEAVVATLGEAVAANLAADDEAAPAPDVEPVAPDEAPPAVRIDPSELEGLVRELEDPGGRAMRPFYEALLRTGQREAGAITRVAHYGDSSIAGDGITVTMRRLLQRRFGDAGHGFVLIARGTMPYHHQDIRHSAEGPWDLDQLVRAGRRDHVYGYGGVLYRAGGGTTARFGTDDRGPVGGSVSRFELWYRQQPRGGRVDLRVDDGEREVVSTRGETTEDAWHTVSVPDGPHRIELRTIGGGESQLYGMVLEREGPGVVYDSLGMVGARARRMLGLDPEHFRAQHGHRQTNLIVLAFGGNDADDVGRTPEQFEDDFRQIIRLARRARPEAGCLLMAPLDQARRDDRGNIVTMDQVPVIVAAERRAAAAEGCAFFDTYEAMGGDGAMRRWFRSNPRLAFGDFRHATPAGYRVVGNMLYRAILKGFSDYLTQS
ncbi:MAG: hypothetical protein H6719_17010 [Sandaracinaceae bacterium]|nr:hypothetical protein [Sandaracinaceae bacterium]